MTKIAVRECLECSTPGHHVITTATEATCWSCGGASFPDTTAEQQRYDLITAGRSNPEPTTPRPGAPTSETEARERWAAGWRPENMCRNCPDLQKPCIECWVRAGYQADNYRAIEAEAAAAPPATQPAPPEEERSFVVTVHDEDPNAPPGNHDGDEPSAPSLPDEVEVTEPDVPTTEPAPVAGRTTRPGKKPR